MTDMAPERFQFPDRITVSFVANPSDAYDLWVCEPSTFGADYVPATALEAAEARIAELTEMLTDDLTAPYLAGLAKGRAEALEEAERACTCKICAGTIRALKEKPNG